MKIVADDRIPFLKGVFEPYCKVQYLPGKEIKQKDVKDADALIVRTRTKCDRSLLEGSKVKIVATATIGTDHFDIEWLEKSGIKWCNAPGCNSGSVKQYMASVLSHLIMEGIEPSAKTIGIIGVGMVGSKVDHLAKSLGFKVLLNDPPRERKEGSKGFCDLEHVIKNADIVTFHTPLNLNGPDATYHLFNDDTLRLVKPGTILINSSRGEVIRTQTLLNALHSGKISKIVLDVWENEPDILPELHKKVWIGTPHIAGYSMDGKANGTKMAVQAVAETLNLPLSHWIPASIPTPPKTDVIIPAGNNSTTKAAQCILQTYDVKDDDAMLRRHPEHFEDLRGNYPVRREFPAWNITNYAETDDLSKNMLKSIGFKIS